MSDALRYLQDFLYPTYAQEREEFAASWRGRRRYRTMEATTDEDLRQAFRRFDPAWYNILGYDGLGLA